MTSTTLKINSYFFIKIFFSPFFLISFLVYSLYLLLIVQQIQNNKEFYLIDRYKKLFRWFKLLSHLKRRKYIFHNINKLIKSPCIFICNEEFNIDHLIIFNTLFKDPSYNLLTFFVTENEKRIRFLKLVNTFKDEKLLSPIIKSKSSIFCNLKGSEKEVFNLLSNNYLPVITVKIETKIISFGKKITIDFSKIIKTKDFLNKTKSVIFTEINTELLA